MGVDKVDVVRWHVSLHVVGGYGMDVAAEGKIKGGVGVHEWGVGGNHGTI